MRKCRIFVVLLAGAVLPTHWANGQETPSLGDAARQSRLQKMQKGAQARNTGANAQDGQSSKPSRVVTNDDIPEHVGSTLTSPPRVVITRPIYTPPSYPRQVPAEEWKALVLSQKNAIAGIQRDIDRLSKSIQYPETCLADCAQRNEREMEKMTRLDALKTQLEQQQKRMEDLQEAARKQGFGSSVYDP